MFSKKPRKNSGVSSTIRGLSSNGYIKIVANGRNVGKTSKYLSYERVLNALGKENANELTDRIFKFKNFHEAHSNFLVPSGPKAQLHLHVVLTEERPDGFGTFPRMRRTCENRRNRTEAAT
jgi:hypothetical protein